MTMTGKIIDSEPTLAIGRVGNILINFTKRFNWFQRKMIKLFFGIEIKNV